MSELKIGNKVMVPRTGGGETPGEVVEIYLFYDTARVRFPIEDTYRGREAAPELKDEYGYKTLRIGQLRLIEGQKETAV